MGTDKRLRRILELGQALIDAPRGVSLDQYAKRHGHSRSALYRDLDVLREVGFPIKSEHGRHRVDAAFQLFGRRGLDPDELLALFAARQVSTRIPGTRFQRAFASLWIKATGEGGQPALGIGQEGALSLAAFDTIDYAPYAAIIDTLDDAIQRRVAVELHYRKGTTGESTKRVVEPGQLHADARSASLFLIGYCRLRKAVRVFAVQRIRAVVPSGERFTLRETRSRVALANAFGVWVNSKAGAPVAVRIRFAPAVAAEIAERRWHASQELKRTPAGGVELSLRLADPMCLVRWLMSFGPDAAVVEPRWLAALLRKRHGAAGVAGSAGAAGRAPIYGASSSEEES